MPNMPKNRRKAQLSTNEAVNYAAEIMQEIGDICSEFGLCIGRNPIEYGCDFITNAAYARDFVDLIDSPGIQLHLQSIKQVTGEYKHLGNNFWVRYTQCKIRAFYAPGASAFFNLPTNEKINIYKSLLGEGIDTVVFIDPPKISNEWKHIGKNNYEYYLFPINSEML